MTHSVQETPDPRSAARFDGDALRDLLERHGDQLLMYALAITGQRQDAEDALQEALARIALARPQARNLRALLYRAVRNQALNLVRRRQRARRRESVASPPAPLFAQRDDRREELDALNASLLALPPDQREVVVMRTWGGLSFDEIARVSRIPRDTAASRYRYALLALRKAMRRFLRE